MKYRETWWSPFFPGLGLRFAQPCAKISSSGILLAFVISSSAANCPAQAQPTAAPLPAESRIERARYEKIARENPTYSAAVACNRDPHEFLLEKEAALSPPGLIYHIRLADAAKAALEAGEKEKARDYAIKALAAADQSAARWNASGGSAARHRVPGVPTADYYANFVLGRLAILDGDIRSAERYLVASGGIHGGDAALDTYGPNLSLALEVLKQGDQQSREAVIQFLDEIKIWWKPARSPYEQWKAQIAAGKIPNFLAIGNNLTY